ncbi:MAG TPA: GNAT family N-acetyltransferase [Chloroflexi bacterium]|nr:GNAT family N-acetyltransferase [Chloroflexota bacterium]
MNMSLAESTYVGDLGDGLICRWSTAADMPKIAQAMGAIYRDSDEQPASPRAMDIARVLMADDFPYMGPGDFALVEDVSKADCPVVAYTCLWRLRWRYANIDFGVGQPEMVATRPEYRNRGLVRALFAMIHARSAAEGHLVQAITGIPYFYRQFGYEYVLDLEGSRIAPVAVIPEKQNDQPEPYALRLATLDDVPQLMAYYALSRGDSLVWNEAPEAFWRHHIAAWDDPSVQNDPLRTILHGRLHMIVADDGATVGYSRVAAKRWNEKLRVWMLHLAPGIDWHIAAPCLLRALRAYGQTVPAVEDNAKPFSVIEFMLGRTHPLYTLLEDTLPLRTIQPYAWYLRVPDIPAFLQRIAPVLEARLAASILAGYSGEMKIDFYRGGLRLVFAEGKFTEIALWRAPDYGDDADAGCPATVFLQLLFCYRSLAELCAFFPDVWADATAARLLEVLFPKLPSQVHALNNA